MLKIIKFICMLMFVLVVMQFSEAKSQTGPGYVYTYDASGNRETRTYTTVYLKRGVDSSSIESKVVDHGITIYPNPTNGELKVDITNLTSDLPVSMELFDMSGRTVAKFDQLSSNNILDLSSLPAGVYIMRLFIGEKHTVWKLIKE